jgi:lysophospholipase L1-like esterase
MRTLRVNLAVALVALGLLVGASGAAAADAKFSAPKNFTLAVGDSLAFGFQQVKFNANPFDVAQFDTGFADVFVARLAATPPGKGVTLLNLGCPGETTASFLSSCAYHDVFHLPLHIDYSGAQIDAAEAILAASRGQVSPILVSLGANDVLALLNVCGVDIACLASRLPAVLDGVAVNLDAALGRLNAAAPDAEIVVLAYYNPIAVIDPATNIVTLSLNAVIGHVAAAHRARVADAFPAFNLAPPQPATLCLLTLMCTPLTDVHASDAGYAVIGNLMFEAAGFTRFEH